MEKDCITKCLEAQGKTPKQIETKKKAIRKEFDKILQGKSRFDDPMDLMNFHGIDGEGVEDLLYSY
jgi:hypothetical protein